MKRVLFILATIVVALISAPYAGACTCEVYGDGTAHSMLRHSKMVFVGKVLDVRPATQSEQEDGKSWYAVRFRIERFWKGVKTNETTVYTDLHGCGPDLRTGLEYLVYAVGKELATGCTRTRMLTLAEEDLRDLGKGRTLKRTED
jgi:hypothetical protein